MEAGQGTVWRRVTMPSQPRSPHGRCCCCCCCCCAGIIVAEGPEEQLDDYISSIRALRWQAMQVRAKEQMPAAVQASASSGGISCFSQPFAELEESGMSDLSQHCSAAGVEHLFLAALKISK
jgi:hypothetical protein